MKEEHAALSKKFQDGQHTLSELGQQLSKVTLENQELKEEVRIVRMEDYGTWQDDSAVNECQKCGKEFGLARRKVGKVLFVLSSRRGQMKACQLLWALGKQGQEDLSRCHLNPGFP